MFIYASFERDWEILIRWVLPITKHKIRTFNAAGCGTRQAGLRLGARGQRLFQEAVGRENLNGLEWVEHQKVRVPRDDMCCEATHSEFKELVIVWIAAG